MTTYSIYVSGQIDEELKRTGQKRGMTPIEVIKERIKNGLEYEHRTSLEARLEAVFQLIELLIPEIGYTSGANRAASANIASAFKNGTETEASLKRAAALIRERLEKKVGEVSL